MKPIVLLAECIDIFVDDCYRKRILIISKAAGIVRLVENFKFIVLGFLKIDEVV